MVFYDEFGPEKIIQLYDKVFKVKSYVVIDNTALGPGKGGIRYVKDVTLEEIAKLARAMTYKNALAEIPYGGAKAGIAAEVTPEKPFIIRNFARMLRGIIPTYYIPGPDMYTNEADMAIIADELGPETVTSKPLEFGGLPHELGSTGYGVATATEIACEHLGLNLSDTTIAIEGFGNVGQFTMKFLEEKGAKIVGVSDSKGMIFNKEGLDFEKLKKAKEEKGSVIYYEDGEKMENSKLFGLEVDVLIPGARPNAINESNFKDIKASIIVEAANIPIEEEIEERLYEKGVLIVPDIIANAGGVISSYGELRHKDLEETFKIIQNKISKNTKLILERSKKENLSTRKIAKKIAEERIRKAELFRRGGVP
ncbi:MAG: Glu/Leu/Phe/Val family dehydrogenase [Candidatus Micrarchaeales archaeon]